MLFMKRPTSLTVRWSQLIAPLTYQGDKIEIWGPIQAPEMVQDVINKDTGHS